MRRIQPCLGMDFRTHCRKERCRVKLPTADTPVPVTSDEETVLEYLSGGRLTASSEIAGALGCSRGKTVQIINRLIGKQKIRIEGAGRGTNYSLVH